MASELELPRTCDRCFVCESDHAGTALHRVCKCKTFVHRACMEAVILRVPSHSRRCPVCRSEYDVCARHACVFRLAGRLASEVVMIYAAAALGGVATGVSYVGTDCPGRGWTDSACTVPVAMALTTSSILLLAVTFHACNGRFCCVERVRTLVGVSLNVPEVQQL